MSAQINIFHWRIPGLFTEREAQNIPTINEAITNTNFKNGLVGIAELILIPMSVTKETISRSMILNMKILMTTLVVLGITISRTEYLLKYLFIIFLPFNIKKVPDYEFHNLTLKLFSIY